MSFIIITIGKPGSGKTTFVKFLSTKFRDLTEYQVQTLNDRDILLDMAQKNNSRDLIRPTDSKNFEVINDSVYDVAIDRLISKIKEIDNGHVLLIEFSRNEYVKTLQRFGDLLANGHSIMVYMNTDFEICKERNGKRKCSVPPAEMDSFFKFDDLEKLQSIYSDQMLILNNDLHLKDLGRRIDDDLWPALRQKLFPEKPNGKLKGIS